MRIVIVDDERPARSELKYLVSLCEPEAQITEAASSEELLELMDRESFVVGDVDINLGGINGTTVASMIKKQMPDAQIIFATAFRDYAVKAFEIGAMDYLLKPFDYERVKKTMERLREQMKEKPQPSEYEINKIMVNTASGYRVVDAAKIVYIETENRACKIHMADGSFYLQKESLNNYENVLRKCRFFRIHKSFLINLDYVQEMRVSYNSGYCVVLRHYENECLPIGRSQIREFRQIFDR